jgi:hypothetical protein
MRKGLVIHQEGVVLQRTGLDVLLLWDGLRYGEG